MDLRPHLLDFSNRIFGGVRNFATHISVFFDPKSKVFRDKGNYVTDKEHNLTILEPTSNVEQVSEPMHIAKEVHEPEVIHLPESMQASEDKKVSESTNSG